MRALSSTEQHKRILNKMLSCCNEEKNKTKPTYLALKRRGSSLAAEGLLWESGNLNLSCFWPLLKIVHQCVCLRYFTSVYVCFLQLSCHLYNVFCKVLGFFKKLHIFSLLSRGKWAYAVTLHVTCWLNVKYLVELQVLQEEGNVNCNVTT